MPFAGSSMIVSERMITVKCIMPMRTLRQFSSISKQASGAPLITFDKASVYPFGETVSPYFTNLTWHIREGQTWAVVGPSTPGRRVLLEVQILLNLGYSRYRLFKGNIGVLLRRLLSTLFCGCSPQTMGRCGLVMLFITCDSQV